MQPELSSALVARDSEKARELEGVLAAAGRIRRARPCLKPLCMMMRRAWVSGNCQVEARAA